MPTQRLRSPLLALVYANLLPQLRQVAREHGYALGIHGSMATDFDLIACPWTDEVSSAEVLAEAMREAVGGAFKQPEWVTDRNPSTRPHGRLAWSIHLDPSLTYPYIDLSVMPRFDKEPCIYCAGKGTGIEGVPCSWCVFLERVPE